MGSDNNYEALKEYLCGSLLKAVIKRVFEKKAVRFVVSAVAVSVSFICMDKVRQYYQGALWYIYGLFTLPFFSLFIAGAAGIISNIGRFEKRRFVFTAVAAGVLMWAVKTIVEFFGMIYLDTEPGLIVRGLSIDLLRNALVMIVSLAIILLPVMISSRGGKRA